LTAAIVALSSCTVPVDPEVSLSMNRIGLGFEGGSFETIVTCNTDWYASSNYDGVILSPTEGVDGDTLHVYIPESNEITTRLISVYVTAETNDESAATTCFVSQEAMPFISSTIPFRIIESKGGNAVFLVNSNHPWEVVGMTRNGEDCSLDIDPLEWDTNEHEVYVTIPPTETTEVTIYVIKLALKDYPKHSVELGAIQKGLESTDEG